MATRPPMLFQFVAGLAIGAHKHFKNSWDWLFAWVYNLKAGDGIVIEAQASDHPRIRLSLIGGPGIKVKPTSGGTMVISLAEEDKDGDDSPAPRPGGSGATGTPGDSGSGGGSGGGGAGGAAGPSDGPGGGASGSGGGGAAGTDCNQFSEDVSNDDGDAGLDNAGDSCAELNGW